MRKRWLNNYARWVVHHAKAITIGAFLVSVAALTVSILFLKTQTGILDLYSEDDPAAKEFVEYINKFGAAETLVVVFEGKSESQRREAIQTLAKKLQTSAHQYVQDILYKIDLDLFKKHAFQFLPESDAKALLAEAKNANGGIRVMFTARDFNDYLDFLNSSLEKGIRKGEAPKADAAQKLGQALEPVYLFNDFLSGEPVDREVITTRLQGETKQRATIDDYGFLRTDDKKMHIMLIRPVDRKQDYKVAKQMVHQVRSKIEEVQAQYPEVIIGVTGGPALNNDQFEISERDMTLASIFAFFSTGVIFIMAFKSFGRPFLGLLTLALALTWAFGLTTLTIGHLNMFSLAFVVILVGQGTYYGVHVVSRYEEELLKGRKPPEAVQETIVHIFGNITTSTITTASAFFATMLVQLKGFAELGWIAGTGILLSSLGMQMVLPAFLTLYDKNGPRGNLENRRQSIFGDRFKGAWLRFAQKLITRYAIILIVIVLGVAGWGAYLFFSPHHGVPFDSNLLNLQAKDTEAVRYEKKLIETSLSPRAGIFLADNLPEAQRIAEQSEVLPAVQRVEWLGDVFPEGTLKTPAHQQLRKTILGFPKVPLRSPNLTQLYRNLIRLEKNLNAIGEKALGYAQGDQILNQSERGIQAITEIQEKVPVFDPELSLDAKRLLADQFVLPQVTEFQSRFFSAIRNMFRSSAQADRMKLAEVPPELLGQFISKDQTYAIYAYPSVNIWERKPLENFVEQLRTVSPRVTGPPIMFYEVLSFVRSSYFKAAGFSALAIFVIFLIDFRSLRYSVLAFLPLVLGIFSLFGLMSVFNLSFNTANLIALPMILGIGADNGVHMIHRFREEHETNINFLFQSTGKALLITYLDTLTSFVGIAVANHQGLAQLGRVVILGITCCTVAGILFLPSVMVVIMRRKKSASPNGSKLKTAFLN